MDNYGDLTQRETDEQQWKAMAELRDNQHRLDTEVEILKQEQKYQRDKDDRILQLISEMNGKVDTLTTDVSQARGGLNVLKSIFSIAVGLSGALVAVWIFLKTGNFPKGG